MKRRFLSILLAFSMAVTLLPAAALATDEHALTTETSEQSISVEDSVPTVVPAPSNLEDPESEPVENDPAPEQSVEESDEIPVHQEGPEKLEAPEEPEEPQEPAKIAQLEIAVDEESGAISGDTATAGGMLSYYLVSEDKADTIAAWTAETADTQVAADLGVSAEAEKPTPTEADNTKYLLVVETKDGKVVAAGQSAAIHITPAEPEESEEPQEPAKIAQLEITVDEESGEISGDTVTVAGTLTYYLVSEDKAEAIAAWTAETADTQVAIDLGVSAEAEKPILTEANNGKYLVVVETKDGKVAAAGQSAVIHIAAEEPEKVDALMVQVDESGVISVGDTEDLSLFYYLTDGDPQEAIAALTPGMDKDDVSGLGTALSGEPALTAANNGKYLVVLACEGTGSWWWTTYTVVAAGSSGQINVTSVNTDAGVSINASGSIKIGATVSGGTYYYAVVDEGAANAMGALTVDSEYADVAQALGLEDLSNERPILYDTENGQYLVIVHLSDAGKLDQYDITEIQDVVPGLKDVYEGMFYIGGTISPGNITSSDYTKWEFIQKHYNALTPENDTKPDVIWNNPDNEFKNPDSVDEMLDSLGDDFYKIGHALAWHNQSTNWPFTAGDEVPTHDEAKALLEEYISTVAGHFQERADEGKSTFDAWDVVNEAMRDNPENPTDWRNALRHGNLPIERPSRWYEAYANGGNGWEYIYDAFVFARKYAPDAKLFYNDFNDEELPNKAIAIASMVTELNAKYAEEQPLGYDPRPLIEGIGIQSHYSTRLKLENLEEVLKIYEATGCEVHITELDVQINGSPSNPPSEADQEVQAEFYAGLFKLYKKYDHIITRVTWWGTNDDGNWRSSQRPMVFDTNWEPKEAYWAVIDPEGYLGYEKETPLLDSFTYGGDTWELVDANGAGETYEFDVYVPDSISSVSADEIYAGLGLAAGTTATVTLTNGGAVADGEPCTATVRVMWEDEQNNYTDYIIHFGHMSAEWLMDKNYSDTGYRSTVDVRFSDGVSQLTLEMVFTDESGSVVKTVRETIPAPAKHESGCYWAAAEQLSEEEIATLTLKKSLYDADGELVMPARVTDLDVPEAYYQLATEVKTGNTYIIVASDSGAAFTHRAAASGRHNGKYQGTSGIVVEDDVIVAPELIQDNIRFVFNPLESPDTDVDSDGFALQSLVHGGLIQPFILWREDSYDGNGFSKLYSDKTIGDADLDRAVWYAQEVDPETHEMVLFLRTASSNETFVLESTDGGDSFGAYGGEGSVDEIIAAHPGAKVKLYEYVTDYTDVYDIDLSVSGGAATIDVDYAEPGQVVTVYTDADVASITVRDGDGRALSVTKVASGEYTFVMPDSSIQIDVNYGSSHTGGSSGSSEPTYEVEVKSSKNGDVESNRRRASSGSSVTLTVTPDRGYELDTLVVLDRHGDKIDLRSKGDGKYTFTMPKDDVTVEATFVGGEVQEGPSSGLPFIDVAANAWYYDAVAYAYENGLMSGTSSNLFSPDATTTRGMIVTMLYRLEGEPRVSGASTFSDVADGMYYADPIAWAVSNGIVTGYDDTTFGPNDAITREQMAAILYRYAQYKGYSTTASADLSNYADAGEVSAYALPAIRWANAEGLVSGTTNTTLTPDGNATRAQVATIFQRFMEDVAR